MLKRKLCIADLDLVTVPKQSGIVVVHAIDGGAITRPEVLQHPLFAVVAQIKMLARCSDVRQHEIRVEAAANHIRTPSAHLQHLAFVVPGGHHQARVRQLLAGNLNRPDLRRLAWFIESEFINGCAHRLLRKVLSTCHGLR